MTTDDELIAEILMVLCFVPIACWLVLLGWDYVAYRWVYPFVMRNTTLVVSRYRRDRILSGVSAYSQRTSMRENERVLR